jgi:glycosyltransferase involved in cell wall biosynthesis
MVIAEAFASGLPVIAFDSGGLRERVHDGRDGLIVSRGDIAGLAAAFKRLVIEPVLRREMGRAARVRAESEFSLPAMLEKYRGIYSA